MPLHPDLEWEAFHMRHHFVDPSLAALRYGGVASKDEASAVNVIRLQQSTGSP